MADPYKFSENAKEYVLVGRSHVGFDKASGERKAFEQGDNVWLEPEQYEAFKDKFEVPERVVVKREVIAKPEAAKPVAAAPKV